MIQFIGGNSFAVRMIYDKPLEPGQSVEYSIDDENVAIDEGDGIYVARQDDETQVVNGAVRIDSTGGTVQLTHKVHADSNLLQTWTQQDDGFWGLTSFTDTTPLRIPATVSNGELMVLFLCIWGADWSFVQGSGGAGGDPPDPRFTWRAAESSEAISKHGGPGCSMMVLTRRVVAGDQNSIINLGAGFIGSAHLRCYRNAEFGAVRMTMTSTPKLDLLVSGTDPWTDSGELGVRVPLDMGGSFQTECWAVNLPLKFTIGLASGGADQMIDDNSRGTTNINNPNAPLNTGDIELLPRPPFETKLLVASEDFHGSPGSDGLTLGDQYDPAKWTVQGIISTKIHITVHGTDPLVIGTATIKRRCFSKEGVGLLGLSCTKVLVFTDTTVSVGGHRVANTINEWAGTFDHVKPAYLP